jgi:hypothetical protein
MESHEIVRSQLITNQFKNFIVDKIKAMAVINKVRSCTICSKLPGFSIGPGHLKCMRLVVIRITQASHLGSLKGASL